MNHYQISVTFCKKTKIIELLIKILPIWKIIDCTASERKTASLRDRYNDAPTDDSPHNQ
jgi:hypothetical protein